MMQGIGADVWPEAIHHLSRVRRVRPGERLLLGDGAGKRVMAKVAAVEKQGIRLMGHEPQPDQPRPAVTLWLANIDKNALEEACHLVCQPGVAAIYLVSTDFAIAEPLREQHVARLQKIILNSCIQAEQAWLPELHATPTSFADLPWRESNWFVAMERQEVHTSLACTPGAAAHVLIGPEGGWSPPERAELLARAAANTIHLLDLGPSILRAQTAALISCWHVAQLCAE